MENDILLIINRFKKAKKISSDRELASFLVVSTATICNWKTRKSINYDVLFKKSENISLDWLITGKGSMRCDASERVSQKEDSGDTEILKERITELKYTIELQRMLIDDLRRKCNDI